MDFRCPKCGFALKTDNMDNTATLQCPACDALFFAGRNASEPASGQYEVIDVHAEVLSPETEAPHAEDALVETSETTRADNQQETPRRYKADYFNRSIVIERREGCGCGGCGCLTLLLLLLFLLFGV